MTVTIGDATVYIGDALTCLQSMESESVQCCVTSPPYWGLRDYQVDNQIGLERTPEDYIKKLVQVFREVRRVLRKDGTCWLNLGDSYAGNSTPGGGDPTIGERNLGGNGYRKKEVPLNLKPKDLVGIPWRTALALQADGWWLRSDIIWHKPNPMPESVTDRPTKSHEYIFLMSKSEKYFYDADAIREPHTSNVIFDRPMGGWTLDKAGRRGPDGHGHVFGHELGRNKRSVWTIPTQPFSGAHFAVFPPALIEPCILAGSKPGDIILDPFFGSGTTGEVALKYGRKVVGIELNEGYRPLWEKRIKRAQRQMRLCEVTG